MKSTFGLKRQEVYTQEKSVHFLSFCQPPMREVIALGANMGKYSAQAAITIWSKQVVIGFLPGEGSYPRILTRFLRAHEK